MKEANQLAAKKKPAPKRSTAKKNEPNDQAESSEPVEQTKPDDDQASEPMAEYQPKHPVLANAGLDQHAAEEARQAELQAHRDEHNQRTGDASR